MKIKGFSDPSNFLLVLICIAFILGVILYGIIIDASLSYFIFLSLCALFMVYKCVFYCSTRFYIDENRIWTKSIRRSHRKSFDWVDVVLIKECWMIPGHPGTRGGSAPYYVISTTENFDANIGTDDAMRSETAICIPKEKNTKLCMLNIANEYQIKFEEIEVKAKRKKK